MNKSIFHFPIKYKTKSKYTVFFFVFFANNVLQKCDVLCCICSVYCLSREGYCTGTECCVHNTLLSVHIVVSCTMCSSSVISFFLSNFLSCPNIYSTLLKFFKIYNFLRRNKGTTYQRSYCPQLRPGLQFY